MQALSNFQKAWFQFQSQIAIGLCLLMMAGMFWSRALLSVSIVVFFVNALNPLTLKLYFQLWLKDKFSVCCFLFFGAYLVSGLWSEDKTVFFQSITTKLPFAVYPFAFLSFTRVSKKLREYLAIGLLMMQTAVIFYSLFLLVVNWEDYIHAYQFSHPLATTKYSDHIRFSLSLVLSIGLVLYYLFEEKPAIFFKRLLIFCGILFFVYLHILAAKTGIVCLYSLAILFVLFKLLKRQKKVAFLLLGMLIFLPIAAYLFIPTFKTKLDYVVYEYKLIRDGGKMDYTLSDQGRVMSYQVGLDVLKQHLWWGTGLGDLRMEMNKEYQNQFPDVPPQNKLIPHNQFLFTVLAVGIVLSAFFLLMLYFGIVRTGPTQLYSKITAFVFILAFMAEAMLEVQFGVFLYLFFTLFWKIPSIHSLGINSPPFQNDESRLIDNENMKGSSLSPI